MLFMCIVVELNIVFFVLPAGVDHQRRWYKFLIAFVYHSYMRSWATYLAFTFSCSAVNRMLNCVITERQMCQNRNFYSGSIAGIIEK